MGNFLDGKYKISNYNQSFTLITPIANLKSYQNIIKTAISQKGNDSL